ncbi:AAA family ATPase [Streptomyces indicus]|uniref:Predicted ATPase n=1 Tax=Streptomyces indicus TaxID=417292 RepID=A0A1G9ARV4_9ACTN|nr:ATP-binding protein [Streptomyces indicus]SDK30082.1 Predicted ATPase [Streptomyces indicus]
MTLLQEGEATGAATAPDRPAAPYTDHPAHRPAVRALRLSAFAGHRRITLPLGPFTLITGPSGSGKSSALRAYELLARLASGTPLAQAVPDPEACVPEQAGPDRQGRRGFRLGCLVEGPAGRVRLDLAVQVEPELRIAGERLSLGDVVLMESALRDPARRAVHAVWHPAGHAPATGVPLPDDQLATALLPLHVAGATDGQRSVLAAAEQAVLALRSSYACDPQPSRMRAPVPPGPGRLLRDCGNLADVLRRTRAECGTRHAQLVAAARAGSTGAVMDVRAESAAAGHIRAVLDRGGAAATPLAHLGDGELRHLALSLVLLTGPGVLAVDQVGEVPSALQPLTVLADGLDRDLDRRQREELLRLAARMCARGHIRLVAAVGEDAAGAGRAAGAAMVDLGRDREGTEHHERRS